MADRRLVRLGRWVLLEHRGGLACHVQHQFTGSRQWTAPLCDGRRLRNNWWLAILTMGEGWHNNHHAYQSSARQGFRWWEFDPTFYILKLLSWARIVGDLQAPPATVLRGENVSGGR